MSLQAHLLKQMHILVEGVQSRGDVRWRRYMGISAQFDFKTTFKQQPVFKINIKGHSEMTHHRKLLSFSFQNQVTEDRLLCQQFNVLNMPTAT